MKFKCKQEKVRKSGGKCEVLDEHLCLNENRYTNIFVSIVLQLVKKCIYDTYVNT